MKVAKIVKSKLGTKKKNYQFFPQFLISLQMPPPCYIFGL
jgi:hypothetical protein